MTCEHEKLGRRMAAEYAEHAQRRNVASMLREKSEHTDTMAALRRAMARNTRAHEKNCEGKT